MNNMMAGLSLLKMVSDMNKRGSGGSGGGMGGLLTDGLNPQGIIPRLMSGNPGGLLGAIMGKPVNPGSPPPAGDPAYVEGGQGPMASGPAAGGMTLGDMLPRMGLLGQMPKFMGGGAVPGIGGLGGW